MQNWNILASLCSWVGWLEPYLVGNSEDISLVPMPKLRLNDWFVAKLSRQTDLR